MPVTVQCPDAACGQRIQVAESQLGQKVGCTRCGKAFVVRSAGKESARSRARRSGSAAHIVTANSGASAVPQRIGRFEIRGHLGSGAFGTVYRARDPQLDRDIALKVPQAGSLEGKKTIERFLREAKAAAALRHPHIVAVHEAGSDGSNYYIASEFIQGRTLAQAIDDRDLDCEAAARIVRSLAEALHYAHGLGIVHRDIKPANVMVDERGEPHLMDFGLAHRQDVTTKLTQAGSILGTPAYMAPEQAEGQTGKPLPASDQYSLGVVLYEMLCGKLPFEGPPQVVLFKVIHTEPESPRSINPQAPRDLETICQKAMAKRPTERYASCEELADDLRRWQKDEPIRARRAGPAERLLRWARRNRMVAALTLVCVIGGASAAALTLSSSRRAQSAEEARKLEEEGRRQAELTTAQQTEAVRVAKLQAKQQEEEAAAEAARRQKEHDAEKVRQEARLEADKAKRAQEIAEERRRRNPYAADLRAAAEAWEQRDATRTRALLDKQRPQAGAEDLRGFEWYYLWRAQRFSVAGARGHEAAVTSLAFSPEGKSVVTGCEDGTCWLWPLSAERRQVRLKQLHPGATCVAVTPDGEYVVATGHHGALAYSKAFDGQEYTWIGSSVLNAATYAVGISPDSKKTISVLSDGTVHVRGMFSSVDAQVPFAQMTGTPTQDLVVCLSPDSRALAFGSVRLVVMDLFTGKFFAPKAHKGKISSLALAGDGRVAVGTEDGLARIIDVQTGKERALFKGHAGAVKAVAFAPDGKTIATGGADHTVRLWNAVSGEQRSVLSKHSGAVTALAFSANGKVLGSGSMDRSLRLWDLAAPDDTTVVQDMIVAPSVPRQPKEDIRCYPDSSVAFSPDGRTLGVANSYMLGTGRHCLVTLWDAATGARRPAEIKCPFEAVKALAMSPDGSMLAATGGGQFALVWETASGRERAKLGSAADACQALAFSPDGKALALGFATGGGAASGWVQLWDTSSMDPARTRLALEHGTMTYVAFSRDGKVLVTGHLGASLNSGYSQTIVHAWSMPEGNLLARLTTEGVKCFALAPNGKTLATASYNLAVKLWDVATGQERASLEGHTEVVHGLAFSNDGNSLASGGEDGTVRLWDPVTGQHRHTFIMPVTAKDRYLPLLGRNGARKTEPVASVAFSPDGRTLAAALWDGTVQVWRGAGDADVK